MMVLPGYPSSSSDLSYDLSVHAFERSQATLRVLHVIPGVAPRYGGPSQAVIQMVRAQRAVGGDVLVATTDADGPGRLQVPLGQAVEYQGVPVIFFRRQWSEAFKYSRPLASWLTANIPRFSLVHIHAVFSHSSMGAARACLRWDVPYVVRPLGSLDPWSLGQKRLRKRLLWHLGVRRMLCGAAAVHYTTIAERRLAEESLGLRNGVVIPHGVDDALLAAQAPPELFRQRLPELGDDPYVLALGRLHPKKQLELFLDVFQEVIRRPGLSRWRLVIAGDGDPAYAASLKNRAARNVFFTGWLDGNEKAAALRGASLVALPSRQENFGLAAVEAMASGAPVLVSPYVNLAEEIAAAGAGWIAPLEHRALADTLAEALSDGTERQRRGADGRQLALRRFMWGSVAGQLLDLYLQISSLKASGNCVENDVHGGARQAPTGR